MDVCINLSQTLISFLYVHIVCIILKGLTETISYFVKESAISKMHIGNTSRTWNENNLENSIANVKKLKRKNRIKSFKVLFNENTKEFCKNTTLHGLSYLVNEDLYPMERTFFALTFVIVVIGAGVFIGNVLTKWSTTPVIFSINPQPTFITTVPFPALTICNMNQAYKSKALQYAKNSTEYAIIQMMCKREVNINVTQANFNWSTLNQFISDNAQPCDQMLISCRFGGREYDCQDLFDSIVTDEGMCCAFNMVHPKFMYSKGTKSLITTNKKENLVAVPWNAEAGYPPKLPKEFYPHKAPGTGESLGLTVIMNVEANEYFCSSSNSMGFKMAMHNPNETPNVREVGLLVAAGYETKARVRLEKLEGDHKLQHVHLKHRQCLFQKEQRLDHFATYTQPNCEAECVANSLMSHCGCIAHFMPNMNGNESVCGMKDVKCAETMRLHSMLNIDEDGDRECDEVCMPSCFDIRYYAEFFTTPLQHFGFQIANQKIQSMNTSYVKDNIAAMTMYYKDNSFRSNKQTEFINITDVLSSVGGLIGLFFGFSFISLVEILFYALIRPWRKLHSMGRKSNAPKQSQDFVDSQIAILNVAAHPLKARRKRQKNPFVLQVSPTIGLKPWITNNL